ncbi:hypothetical protein GCM10010505_33570 [Kitasatospora aburaviensis]
MTGAPVTARAGRRPANDESNHSAGSGGGPGTRRAGGTFEWTVEPIGPPARRGRRSPPVAAGRRRSPPVAAGRRRYAAARGLVVRPVRAALLDILKYSGLAFRYCLSR